MLLYMVDTDESMHTLNHEHMKEAGIEDEDALYRTAMDNLRQRMNGRVQIHHAEGWSLTQIHLDNDYDASLILLLDEVLKDDPMLPANPVFAVPARNALLVCSPSDEEALQAMANIALQAFEDSAYAISTQLYQYHNGTISVFRAN